MSHEGTTPAPPLDGVQARTLALVAVTAALLYICYRLLLPLLPALTWALALAVIAHPVYLRIRRRVRWPDIAAALATTLVAATIVVPTVFVTTRLATEARIGLVRMQEETSGGVRTSCTVEHASAQPEITPAVLAALAERQLICFTGRAGAARVELTSDLICPLAVQSRAASALIARDESAVRDRASFEQNTEALRRSARRSRRWAIVFATLSAFTLLAAVTGAILWINTQHDLARARARTTADLRGLHPCRNRGWRGRRRS